MTDIQEINVLADYADFCVHLGVPGGFNDFDEDEQLVLEDESDDAYDPRHGGGFI